MTASQSLPERQQPTVRPLQADPNGLLCPFHAVFGELVGVSFARRGFWLLSQVPSATARRPPAPRRRGRPPWSPAAPCAGGAREGAVSVQRTGRGRSDPGRTGRCAIPSASPQRRPSRPPASGRPRCRSPSAVVIEGGTSFCWPVPCRPTRTTKQSRSQILRPSPAISRHVRGVRVGDPYLTDTGWPRTPKIGVRPRRPLIDCG